jgi:hypothetical protein
MREILGKHVRRLGNQLPEMEARLLKNVKNGTSNTLSLGKTIEKEGQQIQYYLRGNDEEFDIPDFPHDF